MGYHFARLLLIIDSPFETFILLAIHFREIYRALVYFALSGTTAKLLGFDQLYLENYILKHMQQWQNYAIDLYQQIKNFHVFPSKLSPRL